MNAFVTFANEAREQGQLASNALKYACQNWAIHLSHAPNPWDATLHHIFQAFWNRHLLSWLEMQWCLKGLRPCLVILSEGLKLAKPRTVHLQPNQVPPVIDPQPQKSTIQALVPTSTSEMSTRELSSPMLAAPTELVVAAHAGVASGSRLIQLTSWHPPSTPSPTLPLPAVMVPSPKLHTAMSHTGASKKRRSDELQLDSGGACESAVPTPTKRPKRIR
ncbi:uncharacterized protein EDB91DRAFT_1305783 [Suillus paluster]|uniref:uncharacterized protein n=1 Tax=Suillus paluster TaxID=48578 RepID=UPI001B87C0E0|nr:uncharacterized protein EDB91DRAFT_1305783 [Suillus paluster]KAG1731494.1 hypothetical protein EDB91DRAFT_1305783 [Suillus paluster]